MERLDKAPANFEVRAKASHWTHLTVLAGIADVYSTSLSTIFSICEGQLLSDCTFSLETASLIKDAPRLVLPRRLAPLWRHLRPNGPDTIHLASSYSSRDLGPILTASRPERIVTSIDEVSSDVVHGLYLE